MNSETLSEQMRLLYGNNMVHCSLCVNKNCEHRDELDGGCYAGRQHTDYEIYLWYAWEFGRWNLAKIVKTGNEVLEFLKYHRTATYAVAKDGEIIAKHIGKMRPGMVTPQTPITYSTLMKARIRNGN